jgi:Fe-S-cluster containining protein
MCGDCCRGEGGIVLSAKDQERLAAHLRLTVPALLAAHTRPSGGKPVLSCGPDGACAFQRPDGGCAIHSARPDVCRAWPYFHGNLIDPASLAMAREGCPGLAPATDFEAFRAEGLAYRKEHGLVSDAPDAHNALKPLPGE